MLRQSFKGILLQFNKKRSSRIIPYPVNVDKCLYIYPDFRYIRAFTLLKKTQANTKPVLWQ